MLCKKCNEREVALYKIKHRNYICNRCSNKRDRDSIRNRLFEHYGRSCIYCGSESDLQFDHVNGDGVNDHSGQASYLWHKSLIANDYPPTCQVLCRQCNIAKQQMTDEQFRNWISKLYHRFNP